jgi:CBS domain-containing protein
MVRELMVEPAVTVEADTSLRDTARLMRDAEIGNVIVVDSARPIGIVTDRDIVVRGVAEAAQVATMTVADVCSTGLMSVRPEDDVDHAVAMMRRASVRRLPVIENDQLVGILSLGEVAIDRDETSALADISSSESNS